eukprot:1160813-Pelagomonas_calceolata.AAC.15
MHACSQACARTDTQTHTHLQACFNPVQLRRLEELGRLQCPEQILALGVLGVPAVQQVEHVVLQQLLVADAHLYTCTHRNARASGEGYGAFLFSHGNWTSSEHLKNLDALEHASNLSEDNTFLQTSPLRHALQIFPEQHRITGKLNGVLMLFASSKGSRAKNFYSSFFNITAKSHAFR